MKSYTDIEQSKRLGEIIPLESADMCYKCIGEDPYDVVLRPYSEWREEYKGLLIAKEVDVIPCWSLAALLSILPFHLIIDNQRYEFSMKKGLDKNGEIYAIKYAIFNMTFYFHLTNYYNNPVDACVEMILKLKEKNLI